MARYFFHTEHRVSFKDEEGTELPSLEHAKEKAIHVLTRRLAEDAHVFWEVENLTVTVADEAGLTLFMLTVDATCSPAVHHQQGSR